MYAALVARKGGQGGKGGVGGGVSEGGKGGAPAAAAQAQQGPSSDERPGQKRKGESEVVVDTKVQKVEDDRPICFAFQSRGKCFKKQCSFRHEKPDDSKDIQVIEETPKEDKATPEEESKFPAPVDLKATPEPALPANKWKCACGRVNFKTRLKCLSCTAVKPREEVKTPAKEVPKEVDRNNLFAALQGDKPDNETTQTMPQSSSWSNSKKEMGGGRGGSTPKGAPRGIPGGDNPNLIGLGEKKSFGGDGGFGGVDQSKLVSPASDRGRGGFGNRGGRGGGGFGGGVDQSKSVSPASDIGRGGFGNRGGRGRGGFGSMGGMADTSPSPGFGGRGGKTDSSPGFGGRGARGGRWGSDRPPPGVPTGNNANLMGLGERKAPKIIENSNSGMSMAEKLRGLAGFGGIAPAEKPKPVQPSPQKNMSNNDNKSSKNDDNKSGGAELNVSGGVWRSPAGVGRGNAGRGRWDTPVGGRGDTPGRGRGVTTPGIGRGETPGRGRGAIAGRGRGDIAGKSQGGDEQKKDEENKVKNDNSSDDIEQVDEFGRSMSGRGGNFGGRGAMGVGDRGRGGIRGRGGQSSGLPSLFDSNVKKPGDDVEDKEDSVKNPMFNSPGTAFMRGRGRGMDGNSMRGRGRGTGLLGPGRMDQNTDTKKPSDDSAQKDQKETPEKPMMNSAESMFMRARGRGMDGNSARGRGRGTGLLGPGGMNNSTTDEMNGNNMNRGRGNQMMRGRGMGRGAGTGLLGAGGPENNAMADEDMDENLEELAMELEGKNGNDLEENEMRGGMAGRGMGMGRGMPNFMGGGMGGNFMRGGMGGNSMGGGMDGNFMRGGMGGMGGNFMRGGMGGNFMGGGMGGDFMRGGMSGSPMGGGMGGNFMRGGMGGDFMRGGMGGDFMRGGMSGNPMGGGMGGNPMGGGIGGNFMRGGMSGNSMGGGMGGDFMQSGMGDNSMGSMSGNSMGGGRGGNMGGGMAGNFMRGGMAGNPMAGGNNFMQSGMNDNSVDEPSEEKELEMEGNFMGSGRGRGMPGNPMRGANFGMRGANFGRGRGMGTNGPGSNNGSKDKPLDMNDVSMDSTSTLEEEFMKGTKPVSAPTTPSKGGPASASKTPAAGGAPLKEAAAAWAANKGPAGTNGKKDPPGNWKCPNPSCATSNPSWRQACGKCVAPKPGEGNKFPAGRLPSPTPPAPVTAPAPAGGGAQAQKLDWTCSTCQNWNFGWRIKCKRCECTRPESIDETILKNVRGGAQQVCNDYQKGRCNRDNCRFAHVMEKREVCKNFQHGRCTREDCRFRHVTEAQLHAEQMQEISDPQPQGPAGWEQNSGTAQHNAFTPIWPAVPPQDRKQATQGGQQQPPSYEQFPPPSGGYEQFHRGEKTNNAASAVSPAVQAVLDKVTEATTPLSNLPYSEQVNRKQGEARFVLEQLGSEVVTANPASRTWVELQTKQFGFLAKLEQLRESPVKEGYRNKCEFAIGLNPETNQLTVGFKLDPRSGKPDVGPVEHLKHVPPHMKLVVTLLESYLRSTSYGHFDHMTGLGYWLSAVVRLTQRGKTMLILNFVPQALPASEVATLKSGMVAHWSRGPGSQAALSSLYLATKSRTGPGTMELLLGQEFLTETLPKSGLQMRISPRAYFCINTPGAALLVEAVGKLAGLSKEDTLLDICCGTGTLGLGLANSCGAVYGVDSLGEAVEEAKKNAESNHLQNTLFFTGPAEEILPNMVSQATPGRPIVAVLDPPRTGVPLKAVRELRASRVNRLVFVASDPRACLKSMVDLTRPSSSTFSGDPFLPISVQPLDLFPHTTHYMLLVLFTRVSQADLLYPHRANMDQYFNGPNAAQKLAGDQQYYGGPNNSQQKPPDQHYYGGSNQSQQKPPEQQFYGNPNPDQQSQHYGQTPRQKPAEPPFHPPYTPQPPTPTKAPPARDPREASLSQEQVAWLQQMVDMYGPSFSRKEWVDKFIKDNHEAALKQQQSSSQSRVPPNPPSAPQTPNRRPPSPAIPPMPPFPVAPTSQDPEEYARYKANYDAYSTWYNEYGAAYAAKQERKSKTQSSTAPSPAGSSSPAAQQKLPDPNQVPPGTDPAAWRKYCQETKEYYAKYR